MRLNKQARADLAAWGVFLDTVNGKTFFLDDAWVPNSHLNLYTDATSAYTQMPPQPIHRCHLSLYTDATSAYTRMPPQPIHGCHPQPIHRCHLSLYTDATSAYTQMPPQPIHRCHLSLYTDAACSLGYGTILGQKWFFGEWPDHWKHQNITLLEFFPILAAVIVWAPLLRNKRIMFYTDNIWPSYT